MKSLNAVFPMLTAAVLLSGCGTPQVADAPGSPTVYQGPSSPGLVRGTGIESQDIQSMVDKMVRHMLANPL